MNLSFSGCGFLGIYHVGVLSAFKEHSPSTVQNNRISGCSAGALVAACALCDCCLGQMVSDVLEIALKARSYALGPLHPSFNIVDILRNGLRRILPVDAHTICSNRLHISLTKWKDNRNWLVNTFDTREDLIQALICSSFVPFYSGIMPPKYKGVYCWDGGLSSNNPILDHDTIVISPFGGESDICPREESASFYCFDLQGTNIHLSKENFYRLSKALFPPSPQVLKAICFRGYKDGITFLKSRNLLQCSCQRLLRERSTIQSIVGDDFPLDDISIIKEEISDSDEDQTIQYSKNAIIEPLNYQEMPTPVCDVLDRACADYKGGLISHVYNSKFSRAISIFFLPMTLPIDMSLNFTKRLISYVPTFDLSNNESKNMIKSLLLCYNLLIQRFKYDRYQYHSRAHCKLCVLQSSCHCASSHSQITTVEELVLTQSEKIFKLCPRHRVPSMYCGSGSSNSENENSLIKTVSIKKLNRRKYSTSFSIDIEKSEDKLTGLNSFKLRNKTISLSLPSATNYFDKQRTEKKLRNYKVNYNKSIKTTKEEEMKKSISLDNLNKSSSDDSDDDDDDDELKNSYEIINTKKFRSNDYIIVNKEKTEATSSNQTSDIDLNFSLKDENDMIKSDTDKLNHQNEHVEEPDFDNYLDKFELNIFGNI